MNEGFVKLWRKAKESAVFAHDGLWKLWCLCLMKASHKGYSMLIGTKPITLQPGQFVTGRHALWEDYHQWHLIKRKPRRKPAPSAKTIRRFLLTLEKMQMLSIKRTNKYSIVSIVNWNQYQENVHQVVQQLSTNKKYTYIGKFFSVDQDRYQTYLDAFPGMDIMAEFRKMDAWLESNPSKRKTERGYPRFVNHWLGKAFKAKREESPKFWDNLKEL